MKFMSEEEVKKENEEKTETNSRVYELGYILVPTLEEANVPTVYGDLKELISSLDGVFISEEMPKMITLAYVMTKVIDNVKNKFNTGYFGWTKFTMEADKVLKLKKKLDFDKNIIRFLILKTVKENTIAAKRFTRGDVRRKSSVRKIESTEPAIPINKEEIDKEIDALIEA